MKNMLQKNIKILYLVIVSLLIFNYVFDVSAIPSNSVNISCDQEITVTDNVSSYLLTVSVIFELNSVTLSSMMANKLAVTCNIKDSAGTSYGEKREIVTYYPDTLKTIIFTTYIIEVTEARKDIIKEGEFFTVEIVFKPATFYGYQKVGTTHTNTFLFIGNSPVINLVNDVVDTVTDNSSILLFALLAGGFGFIMIIICVLYLNNPKTANYQRFQEKKMWGYEFEIQKKKDGKNKLFVNNFPSDA